MGNVVEGGDGDGGNGTGAGGVLQGNRSVSVVIWYQELGGDGGHANSTIGIPSSGS